MTADRPNAAKPFPLVEVRGAPFERGRQHGQAAKERVERSVAIYAGRLRSMDWEWSDIRAMVEEFVPAMTAFSEDHVAEMRGIAEGAGLEFASIALINARTEVLQLGRRRKEGRVAAGPMPAAAAARDEGCTTAVVLPGRSATGRLLHGQNWDWRAECADSSIVLLLRRDDGPDVLTFTEAGQLMRHGFNAAGHCITGNYLESDRDYRQSGVPLPLVRRKALEAEHFADAIKYVATTPKSASNNMLMSRADGFVINFECAPDEAFATFPEDGLLVHANHWTSQAALAKLKETGIAGTPDSYFRAWRARQVLEERGRSLTVGDLKAALLDDRDSPNGVCQPPAPYGRGDIGATVATIIMDPAEGTMEVAPLPAQGARFTTYSLQGRA